MHQNYCDVQFCGQDQGSNQPRFTWKMVCYCVYAADVFSKSFWALLFPYKFKFCCCYPKTFSSLVRIGPVTSAGASRKCGVIVQVYGECRLWKIWYIFWLWIYSLSWLPKDVFICYRALRQRLRRHHTTVTWWTWWLHWHRCLNVASARHFPTSPLPSWSRLRHTGSLETTSATVPWTLLRSLCRSILFTAFCILQVSAASVMGASGLQCFDTVGWGCRKGIWLIQNWVVGCWHGYLSGVRCRRPADATATHCLLLH